MFKKVKEWFGVDSVKVHLEIPSPYDKSAAQIEGAAIFMARQPRKVQAVSIRLVERYARGRGDERRIDEYELGHWQYEKPFEVTEEYAHTLRFELPFERLQSNMDRMAESGFALQRGFAQMAKRIKKVRSTYHIELEAHVEGAQFTVHDKREITFE